MYVLPHDKSQGFLGLVLTVLITSILLIGEHSYASAIACSGGYDDEDNSIINYDHSAGTCAITDGATTLSDTSDINFAITVADPTYSLEFLIGTGGATSNTGHTGCDLGTTSIGAGSACTRSTNEDGARTAKITISITGGTAVMDVSYTVDYDSGDSETEGIVINSASVTVTTTSSSSTAETVEQQIANDELQVLVSRSQSFVVIDNIDARLSAAQAISSQISVPTTVVPDVPNTSSNFSFNAPLFAHGGMYTTAEVFETGAEGSWRDVAMRLSFDTSQLGISSSNEAPDSLDGISQRLSETGGSDMTVWGHGAYTLVENDYQRGTQDNRYDGDVWGYNLGADYRFNSSVLMGAALGYAETDMTTTFNSGTFEETTWTFSPYLLLEPSENITASVVAGYSLGDIERERGAAITSDTTSRMWFTAVNATYDIQPLDSTPLEVVTHIEFFITRKRDDAYVESDGSSVAPSISNTRQLKPGIEIRYTFEGQEARFQPYLRSDYIHDFADTINSDRNAYNIIGGARLSSASTGLTGAIEAQKQSGRSDFSEETYSGLIAYRFTVSDDGQDVGFAEPYIKTNMTDEGHTRSVGVSFVTSSGLTTKLDVTQEAPSELDTAPVITSIDAVLKF